MVHSNAKDGLPQLDLMRQGVDYRIKVKLRGFEVMLRPLTIDETTEVVNKVMGELLKFPEHLRHAMNEDILKGKEILHMASTSDVDVYDPKLGYPLLGRMTTDEIYTLYKNYLEGVHRANPSIEALPKNVLVQMVEELKKNPSELKKLSLLEMENVCRYLISEDSHTAN